MSGRQPSAASDDVWVGINNLGNTEYYHRPCGQVWYQKQGDASPNHCPKCGEVLFDE